MLKVFIYNKNAPRSLGIIAAQHGNEKSPSIIMQDLIKTNYFRERAKQKNICIKVIPIANELGYKLGTRTRFGIDINRCYNGKHDLNNRILEILSSCDNVLDFHEGWGFYNEHKGSLGSSITCNSARYDWIVKDIIHSINLSIPHMNYKFAMNVFNPLKYEGSLIYYCVKNNINCAVIEITGQNNKVESLGSRKKKTFYILDSFIDKI